MGFVRRLRLEQAALRLKIRDVPITDIALRSGYSSHEAFTRAFRSRFGTSPRRYRAQSGPSAAVPNVRMERQPQRCIIRLRHVGPYETCGPAWDAMERLIETQALWSSVSHVLGVCFDDPDITDPQRLRYDVAIALEGAPAVALPPEFTMGWIPAGEYAVALHKGPYETLHDTYVGMLGRFLPFWGVELAAEPIVERYLTHPAETAPEESLTEVMVRIQ